MASLPKRKNLDFKDVQLFDNIAEPDELKKIICNDIFLLGGQYAILCQWAHPGLAVGTYRHSSFGSRLMQRLQNTARFLNVTVYGTVEEKRAIAYVIHRYHSRVKGDGYDADDPELHKWTAATLFMALVVVHETFIGKMDRTMMEKLFKESAAYATGLRMPPEMWPETLDDFMEYWNHNINTLEVTPEAKLLCRELLYPAKLPLILQLGSSLTRVMTINWLPERLAREYEVANTKLDQLTYYFFVTGLCVSYPLLPAWVRTLQHERYMNDMRKAVQKIRISGHWGAT